MREILFKAKRKENGRWVEGYYQKRYDLLGNEEHFIFTTSSYTAWEYAEIDPETLCEYTGLTDKNGNKIWENDICDKKEPHPKIVMQYHGDWTMDYSYAIKKKPHTAYCNLGFYVSDMNINCVEVIGNIFDNPELLQEEKYE